MASNQLARGGGWDAQSHSTQAIVAALNQASAVMLRRGDLASADLLLRRAHARSFHGIHANPYMFASHVFAAPMAVAPCKSARQQHPRPVGHLTTVTPLLHASSLAESDEAFFRTPLPKGCVFAWVFEVQFKVPYGTLN